MRRGINTHTYLLVGIFLSVLLSLAACSGRDDSPLGPDLERDDSVNIPADPWSFATIGTALTLDQLRSGNLGGQTLHCAGPLHEPSEYENYVEAFATHPPAMWVTYYSLVNVRFTPAERLAVLENELARYGGLPFLGISYTEKLSDGSQQGWDSEVAAGLFDGELRAIAKALAKDGRPILLRPGFEFNGAWNGYHPESYRSAFIHIRSIFDNEGADNVVWLWNAHPAGKIAPFMEFYPGDEFVDWWGINLFGNAFDSPTQRAFTGEFIAAAKARGKPLSIPESIPSKTHLLDDPATWSAWFTPYFDLIREEGIAAFCYSNRDYTKVPAWSDWGDLRIERSPLRDAWESVLGEGWVKNAPFND